MKKIFNMKKYLLDQLILMIVFIVLSIVFYYLTSKIIWIMILIEITIIWSFSCLLKRFLLLPIDILKGAVEKDVFFSSICNIQEYEFFRENFYCEWHFYFSAKDTLTVLVPISQTYEEILKMDIPVVNQKVRIRYYRYSKILSSWEIL